MALTKGELDPDLDFAGEVAESELGRLVKTEAPFVFVEIDGQARRRYSAEFAGRHAGQEYFRTFCEMAVALARTWTLGCRAVQEVRLPGRLGRMRGGGGSRRWSAHHSAVWAVVAVEGWNEWRTVWQSLADSCVRLEDYRIVLPSMRPTEDPLLLDLQKNLPRPRSVPFPRRPEQGRGGRHRDRIVKIRSYGANDGVYRPDAEIFAEMTFEDLDE